MRQNELCKGLTYEDCELAILRSAVDKSDKLKGKEKVESPELKKIISIVENFLKIKGQICYGGTAINNILPAQDQFYDKNIEIPDYDFFSMTPLEDAKELADIYYKAGFEEVEAKAGVHYGTFKVFVNFIPVADITLLSPELFKNLKREAIRVAGILYSPPNYLRMAMYLELSRPDGDTSRWEKVLKRITLLNKNYPLIGKKCREIDFQRGMENNENESEIYEIVKTSLIDQGSVFFGGLANTLYSQYMPKKLAVKLEKLPDFDVLSEDANLCATIVKERLEEANYKKVSVIFHEKIGEVVSEHYEVRVGNDTLCFIYKPLACHSYNEISLNGKKVKVATIDTMLSFYLAFLYTDRKYYDKDRILCMSQYLFIVQQKNRLAQKGLLRRFSLNCYGKQETLESMRAEKTEKFMELKDQRDSSEYESWFLRYVPRENKKNNNKKFVKKAKVVAKSIRNITAKVIEKTKQTVKKRKNKKTNKKKKGKHKTRKSKNFFGLF